ncbi:histidine kinase dimerization/phosphoacceptor domain -containing protein [Pseudoprimorskyibacter insulae]|uniref:Putative sensor histidine kinase pdtaS n=1 Tax=Pseudoprimorskyibacter insulae TaxID=1695997 RepID=A0A2R8AWL6_9RHOB|nr:histidine kinase dimerization/phosphoacceptor domain -containing protein [Pseudoprimorskyibacter insulae]SPF80388.1 putative sensor histidine kinase pdtaS [Pseudoprimorskyibacter insulae]
MEAPLHHREAERLETLQRKNILDPGRQPEYDEIVRLVADICDAPVALISFVERDRQWFKAEVGLGVDQTPRDQSICAHVVYVDEYVEISDTLNDPRTLDNPLCVSDPNLRFYAGMPLRSSDGLPLGTLCVLDHEPRTLNNLQRDTLRVMSRQIMRLLQLDLALKAEEILRGEIDHRVKNSLQTVLSVLRLYKSRIRDAQAQEAFQAVRRRIEAIAALHEALYKASRGHSVRLDQYLAQIVGSLQATAPANVSVNLDCPNVLAPSNEATAMAIIISEFTANSMKHAFPSYRRGNVDLTISVDQTGAFHLRCADDGVGTDLRSVPAPGEAESLGLKLMEAAAMQIGASLTRSSDDLGFQLELTTAPIRNQD